MNITFSDVPCSPEEQRNRQAVLDLYMNVIQGAQYHRAAELLDPGYKQHRPGLADGPEGVINFARGEHARVPGFKIEILRCFVDGDYVIVHMHAHLQPAEPDRAVMDIFRCKNGRLLEHWDVDQSVPPVSGERHGSSMF